MKTYFNPVIGLAVVLLSGAGTVEAGPQKTSGVYLTADDYKNDRRSFEGECSSQTHKLELHDVLNKPYIEVTHESKKQRYQKNELFGFRACDARDYRFASNREYQILESKELYIYVREVVTGGKVFRTIRTYYFSPGAGGPVLALTLENLKQAFPDNHRFHDSLDLTFGAGQTLAEYDEVYKMFKVNRLLIGSR
jgi:hypothetical protein